jgi:hypothetical protein
MTESKYSPDTRTYVLDIQACVCFERGKLKQKLLDEIALTRKMLDDEGDHSDFTMSTIYKIVERVFA